MAFALSPPQVLVRRTLCCSVEVFRLPAMFGVSHHRWVASVGGSLPSCLVWDSHAAGYGVGGGTSPPSRGPFWILVLGTRRADSSSGTFVLLTRPNRMPTMSLKLFCLAALHRLVSVIIRQGHLASVVMDFVEHGFGVAIVRMSLEVDAFFHRHSVLHLAYSNTRSP